MNHRILILPLAAVAAAAMALGGGVANAATPSSPALSPAAVAVHSAARPADDAFQLKLTITNNTNQNWTFSPQNSHSGDDSDTHWEQRPQVTLGAKTTELVTTETDDPAALDTQVTYQMANGEYASVEATDWLNTENGFNFAGVSTSPQPYQYNENHSTPWPTDQAWTAHTSMQHSDHPTAAATISAAN